MPIELSDYQTLSAIITPALFMTANGSLIISTSNRMARVVDRTRALSDRTDELCRGATDLDYIPERRAHVADQLRRQVWRGERLRIALTMLYVAFAAFAGTSLTLTLDVGLSHRILLLPTGLAVLGVALMLVACINLIREAFEAMRSNRLEVRFVQDLERLREAEGRCAAG